KGRRRSGERRVWGVDRVSATRREPRDELLVAHAGLAGVEVVASPYDDVLGRMVHDRPNVAREKARAPRASTETRLEHRCSDALAQRRPQERERRRDNGGNLRVGEERHCRADPVACRPRPTVQHSDERATRLPRRGGQFERCVVEHRRSLVVPDDAYEWKPWGTLRPRAEQSTLALIRAKHAEAVEHGCRVPERTEHRDRAERGAGEAVLEANR